MDQLSNNTAKTLPKKRKINAHSERLLKRNKVLSNENKRQKLEIETLQAQNKYLLERIEMAKDIKAITKCDLFSCTNKVQDFTPYRHRCTHVLCNHCKRKTLCLICRETKREVSLENSDNVASNSKNEVTNTENKTDESMPSCSKDMDCSKNELTNGADDVDLIDDLSALSDDSVYSPGQHVPIEEM